MINTSVIQLKHNLVNLINQSKLQPAIVLMIIQAIAGELDAAAAASIAEESAVQEEAAKQKEKDNQ